MHPPSRKRRPLLFCSSCWRVLPVTVTLGAPTLCILLATQSRRCLRPQGIVTQVTDVRPLVSVVTYTDEETGHEIYQEVRTLQLCSTPPPFSQDMAYSIMQHDAGNAMCVQSRDFAVSYCGCSSSRRTVAAFVASSLPCRHSLCLTDPWAVRSCRMITPSIHCACVAVCRRFWAARSCRWRRRLRAAPPAPANCRP